MPITNASIALPGEVSNVIVSNVVGESAVMRLARQIPLPGHGAVVPVITGDPTAYFVDEGGVKTNSDATLAPKTMKGRTIAIIEPFSNQFRNDNEALYQELINRLPALLAQKFDEQVFHGTAVTGFDSLKDSTAVSLGTDCWKGLVTAKETIETANGELNGWAMSNQMETKLLGEVDSNKRPLFVSGIADGALGRILAVDAVKAKKAYKAGSPAVLGFAGDWSKALYGIVNGVNVAISDSATLKTSDGTINLFEQNMFAVRAEIEVGFVAAMANQFVKITA